MDSRTVERPADGAAEQQPLNELPSVVQGLHIIKTRMPNVYRAIQAKAADIGDDAYSLVRRGLAGQAGCFYALEGGHVVGTVFGRGDPRMQQLAEFLVFFGCAHVCIWPMTPDEVRHYGAT